MVVRDVIVHELAVMCVNDIKFTKAFNKIPCEAPQGKSQVLELIVDTILYQQHFAHCSLIEPKVKLITYTKGDLPVIGCLGDIENQENKVPALFNIVKAGSPLLELDLNKALYISIIGEEEIHTKKDNAKELFTGTPYMVNC